MLVATSNILKSLRDFRFMWSLLPVCGSYGQQYSARQGHPMPLGVMAFVRSLLESQSTVPVTLAYIVAVETLSIVQGIGQSRSIDLL